VKVSQALIGVTLVILTACKPQEQNAPQEPDARQAARPKTPSPQVALDPEEAVLAEAFISAVNSDDRQKLEGLVHSQCRAHITPDNRGFFDAAFDHDLAESVPAQHEWGFVRMPEGPPPLSHAFNFPVRPTHQLQITFGDDPEEPERITHYVARDGKRWAIVIPYPTEEALARMREAGRIPNVPSTTTDSGD